MILFLLKVFRIFNIVSITGYSEFNYRCFYLLFIILLYFIVFFTVVFLWA